MGSRRGMELTFSVIIIAILAALILVISIFLLMNGVKTYSTTEKSVTSCGSGVLSGYECTQQPGEGQHCLRIGCAEGEYCCKQGE